jgi:class 3 adenylate cyclase
LAARLKDLEAVVDSAEVDHFVLCGYGQGGPVAITYAVNCPERVSHLVLVNSFALGSAYYQGAPVMQALIGMRAMAEEQWEFFTLTIATASLGFADTALARKTAELFRSSTSAKTFLSFVDAAEKVDVLDLLPEVRVPTLVVLDRSGFVTEDLARVLASSIPSARFATSNDYAHELHSFVRGEPLAAAGWDGAPSGTAVILFADIAESTALTERLGDGAFRDKARNLDGELRKVIHNNGGTPIDGKLLGDGVLATFASAKQAIEAALACGRAGDEMGLPLHLGLHAGDVIREDNNVFGGAVNIAARVSALSGPGEVLVSGTVRDLARTSAGVSFVDCGEQELKGVGEAVRLFVVRQGDA